MHAADAWCQLQCKAASVRRPCAFMGRVSGAPVVLQKISLRCYGDTSVFLLRACHSAVVHVSHPYKRVDHTIFLVFILMCLAVIVFIIEHLFHLMLGLQFPQIGIVVSLFDNITTNLQTNFGESYIFGNQHSISLPCIHFNIKRFPNAVYFIQYFLQIFISFSQ